MMDSKPQNGLAGLKHWRYDMMAGLQVALVSLPLSLGIAVASGAPPVTGLVSAIIAGLIFPVLGGAYVTISGPAAGLAPALMAGMLTLGHGDLAAGYPLLLVAIFLTGALQQVLAAFRAGKFSLFFPVVVVEGMLAAIGLIIIIKQLPLLVGDPVAAPKNMLAAVANLPTVVRRADLAVFVIGTLGLALMFALQRWRLRFLPPPLAVAAFGIAAGYIFDLPEKYLIHVPGGLLDSITLPRVGDVWSKPDLWFAVLTVVITLTLIDSIESLATISAVDKIDPYRRQSDPNQTLRAMGVSNMLSSLAGGLTIIPGGVKSRANIDAGGRTLWANGYNAIYLLIFLALGAAFINRIPLAALAAVLVYVGWRLCEPQVFAKTLKTGIEELLTFTVTILGILATDLLVGIFIGIGFKLLMMLYLLGPALNDLLLGRVTLRRWLEAWRVALLSLFRNPVIRSRTTGGEGARHHELTIGTAVCFNLLQLDRELEKAPRDAAVSVVVTESVRFIDHTVMEYFAHQAEQLAQAGRAFRLAELEQLHRVSGHPMAAAIRDARMKREQADLSIRQQEMQAIAARHQMSISHRTLAVTNTHGFVYFSRGDNKRESNTIGGEIDGWPVKVFDYSHTAVPDYYAEHRHSLLMLSLPCELPDFVITPHRYLERYLVELQELTFEDDTAFSAIYHVYGVPSVSVRPQLSAELRRFLLEHPGFYVEFRRRAVLAFRPRVDLEPGDGVDLLLVLARLLRATLCPAIPREAGVARHETS